MTKEERNARARERAAAWRKTDAYRKWLLESRERRAKLKEKYRRQAGIKSRDELRAEKQSKEAKNQAKREEKLKFLDQFIGPPLPTVKALGSARYQRFLYQREHVRQYQIEKRKRYADSVTYAYAREQLHMKNASQELVEVMRVKLLIKRDISRLTNAIKEATNA